MIEEGLSNPDANAESLNQAFVNSVQQSSNNARDSSGFVLAMTLAPVVRPSKGSLRFLGLGTTRRTFSWNGTNYYKNHGNVSAIEHIWRGHSFGTAPSNKSKFLPSTSQRNIVDWTNEAIREGQEVVRGRNSIGYVYTFDHAVGYDKNGGLVNTLQVYTRDGKVQTSYPIPLP